MTRAQLVLHLAALVGKRQITQAQAAALIAMFDAGEFVPSDLPPQEDSRNDWLAALLLLLLLTRGNTATKLSAAKRRFARNTLRRSFEADMARLAVGVTTGALTLQAWQEDMQVTISRYTRQMAVAGAGTLPSAATQAVVEAQLAEQWPFLRGFALTVAARRLVAGKDVGAKTEAKIEAGMSAKAVASRARLYGNVGWRSFYEAQSDELGWGWVEQYFTRDDKVVCSACGPRHGKYYLAGQGPMPGYSFCYGVCRCERRPVYAPEIYMQLTGQKAA